MQKYGTQFTALLLLGSLCSLNGMDTTRSLTVPVNKDRNIKQYSKNFSLEYVAAMSVIAQSGLQDDDIVLDIGSDNRAISKVLAGGVSRGTVTAIDSSENMIKFARESHEAMNLFFRQIKIENYKTDPVFTKAFAFASLVWVKNQQKALVNIFNALKPGGKLFAGLAHEDSPYLRARYAMHSDIKWTEYFVNYEAPYYPFNEERADILLKHAGFSKINMTKNVQPTIFKKREDFIAMMRVVPAQLDKIPEERREEFLNDIVDKYLEEVPLKKGSIELFISELFVVAEKS